MSSLCVLCVPPFIIPYLRINLLFATKTFRLVYVESIVLYGWAVYRVNNIKEKNTNAIDRYRYIKRCSMFSDIYIKKYFVRSILRHLFIVCILNLDVFPDVLTT